MVQLTLGAVTEEKELNPVRRAGGELQGGNAGCPELPFSAEGRQEEESVPHQPGEARG